MSKVNNRLVNSKNDALQKFSEKNIVRAASLDGESDEVIQKQLSSYFSNEFNAADFVTEYDASGKGSISRVIQCRSVHGINEKQLTEIVLREIPKISKLVIMIPFNGMMKPKRRYPTDWKHTIRKRHR